MAGLEQALHTEFGVTQPVQKWLDDEDDLHEEPLRERIVTNIRAEYDAKCSQFGEGIRIFEKQIMLQILDSLWKEHLAAMDYLRQGIHLRAYAQKQPKQEYKREAFELFEELLESVKFEVVKFLARVQFQSSEDVEAIEQRRREEEARKKVNYQKAEADSLGGEQAPEQPVASKPFVRNEKKVGRNEPCPCGSGKKYKACHGKLS